MTDVSLRIRISEWWWWHAGRHLEADAICRRVAFWLPRRLALWAFIRVYAAWGECGPDYPEVYSAWENGAGR
jgi:hypothetical protein